MERWQERLKARARAKARRKRPSFGARCLALALRLRKGRLMDDYLRRAEWTQQQTRNEKANRKVFTDANLIPIQAW